MSLLYNLNESTVVEKVTMKWPSDEYVIPAGTPMSRTGIANDKNAIGILANEAKIKFHYPLSVAKHIGKEEPKGKQDYTFSIITSGFVNLTEAEASFGAKISEEAKSAMGEINFVDETEPASFGGGGGSNILEVLQEGYSLTWDGNTDGLFSFDIGTQLAYLVSEDVPSFDALESVQIIAVDGTVITKESFESMGTGIPFIMDMSSNYGGESCVVGFGVLLVYENIETEYVTLRKGVYFVERIHSFTIPKKEQIKEEYIPDSLKGGGGSAGSAPSDLVKIIDKYDIVTGNTTKSYKINDVDFNVNGTLPVEEASNYEYIGVDKGLCVYVDYEVIEHLNTLNKPNIEFVNDMDGIITKSYGFICDSSEGGIFYFPYYNGEMNYFIVFREGYPPSEED